MTMTETAPDTETGPPPDSPQSPAEPTGLAGWLTTGDHKRIGRLYIFASLIFLIFGGIIGQLLAGERAESGLQIIDEGAFEQVYTLHGSVAVFLFLVPAFIGLATCVVPLQVGARNIAFPRATALAFWLYIVAGGILLAAYAADGGPGGADPDAVDLWLVALGALNASYVLALISLVTTVICLRAPGMSLVRTPAFSWSILVGGGLTLLASPVLIANVIMTTVDHSLAGGEVTGWGPAAWFLGLPQIYLLVIPAAGIAAEIVPVVARLRPPRHGAVLGVLAGLALLGFGGFVQADDARTEVVYVGVGLLALLPAIGLVALLADTLRRGSPTLRASLLLGMGSVLMILLGVLTGAVAVIEPLDLAGTTWLAGHVHLVLFGGGVLGIFAGLNWWAPKLWGTTLGEGAGFATFALVFVGGLLLAAPDLVSGIAEEQALAATDSDGIVSAMNIAAAVGGALGVLGVLVFVVDLLRATGRRRVDTVDDPWGGQTLEWTTTSPPPADNFVGPVPAVRSASPILDRLEDTEARS
jgi:cytochrome c oxidase subunit I